MTASVIYGLLWLIHHVFSISIIIQNAGFEYDDYPLPSNTLHYEDPIISNWQNYDPNSILHPTSIGIANPNGGTSINDTTFGNGTPEGMQCAYVYLGSNDQVELGIFQTITAYNISANTIYNLSVWIGNPLSNTWSDGTIIENTAFHGYSVQLLDTNNTIIAEDDNKLNISESEWMQSIITVTIMPESPYIDNTLTVRLINKGTHGMVYFDDIILEAIPIASPTTKPLTAVISLESSTTSSTQSMDEINGSNALKKSILSLKLLDWIFIILGLLVLISIVILMILIGLFMKKRRRRLERKIIRVSSDHVCKESINKKVEDTDIKDFNGEMDNMPMMGGNHKEHHNVVHITSNVDAIYVPPQKRDTTTTITTNSTDNEDEHEDERLMDEIELTVQYGEDEEVLAGLEDTPDECADDEDVLNGLEDTPEQPDPDDDVLVGLEDTPEQPDRDDGVGFEETIQ